MRRRGNTGKDVTIGIMLVAILTMAIGYAILQQRLNIEGTANVSSVWDVQVTGIKEFGLLGLAETDNVDYTPTSATFSTNLNAPNDYAFYEIVVENKGSLIATSSLAEGTNTYSFPDGMGVGVLFVKKEPIEKFESLEQMQIESEKTTISNQKHSITLAPGEKAYYYATAYLENVSKLPTESGSFTFDFSFTQAINFPMSKTLDVNLRGTLPDGITVDPIATLTNSSDYTSQQLTIVLKRDTSVNTNVYSGCNAKISYMLTDGTEDTNTETMSPIVSAWWTQEELDIFTDSTMTEQIYNFNLNISPDLEKVKTLMIYNGCL